MKTTLLLTALLLATTAHAQVHRCEIDGVTTFQSSPCPGESAEIRPEPQPRPTTPATRTPGQIVIPDKTLTEIRAYCTHRWGSDFRMRNHCYEQQTQAWRNLSRQSAANRGNERIETIAINCLSRWQQRNSDHGFDWRMVEHCYNQQTEAAQDW